MNIDVGVNDKIHDMGNGNPKLIQRKAHLFIKKNVAGANDSLIKCLWCLFSLDQLMISCQIELSFGNLCRQMLLRLKRIDCRQGTVTVCFSALTQVKASFSIIDGWMFVPCCVFFCRLALAPLSSCWLD